MEDGEELLRVSEVAGGPSPPRWRRLAFLAAGAAALALALALVCIGGAVGRRPAGRRGPLPGSLRQGLRAFDDADRLQLTDDAWSSEVYNVAAKVSLFCWCEMQPGGVEEELVRLQLEHRTSLFACDEYAVLSPKKRQLGTMQKGEETWPVFTWVNPAPPVTEGKYGVNGITTNSFLNTLTFIQAWDILMGSGKLWAHDWVVKVDPDAVFLPGRLAGQLSPYQGTSVYFANCGNAFWTGLYGALEVFSTSAILAYQNGVSTCKDLPWAGWGEDYYMEKCMQALGVWQVLDTALVGDMNCKFSHSVCNNTSKAAFHHYKTPEAYLKCLKEANLAQRQAHMERLTPP